MPPTDLREETRLALLEGNNEGVLAAGNKLLRWRSVGTKDKLYGERNGVFGTDIGAGTCVVQVIHDWFVPILEPYGTPKLWFLTEETCKQGFRMKYREQLTASAYGRIKDGEQFFVSDFVGVRVLGDPCDGSVPYKLGWPNWASSSSVIIDDDLAMSSHFEPVDGMLYYAYYKVPGGRDAVAFRWNSKTDETVPLLRRQLDRAIHLNEAAVGYHLPRHNKTARQAFRPKVDLLDKYTLCPSRDYCGLVSLRKVCTGELQGYANPALHLWDVTGCILLVEASGGKITQMNGKPFSFGSGSLTSVLAAATPELHTELLEILNSTPHRDRKMDSILGIMTR
jgi:fructose-1,6-bisphosphatase/inositol monophosphatase family enzyme